MNTRQRNILAAVLAILVTGMLLLDLGQNPGVENARLLPDLKSHINDVTSLVIRNNTETVTLEKSGDSWSVRERSNYAADIGKLRQLLLALADARVLELKTSNPEKYSLLGVNDPTDNDSKSVEITLRGGGLENVLVLGKTAQGNYRYARVDGTAQSVLIDRNPDVPGDAGDWLAQTILDVSAERVQRVTITHAGGEEIRIEKESQESSDFQVMNLPAGRELSYPSVANGIGGALGNLTLSDVREAAVATKHPDVLTTFQTFDGLTIEIRTFQEEDASWFSVTVSNDASNDDPEAVDEAAEINQRVSGWLYAVADYKARLLQRHFEDILKAADQGT